MKAQGLEIVGGGRSFIGYVIYGNQASHIRRPIQQYSK